MPDDGKRYALVSMCGLLLVCAGNQVTTWDHGYAFDSYAQWQAIPQPEGDGFYIFLASNGWPLYAADDGSVSLWLPDYSSVRPNVLWNTVQAQYDEADHMPWWSDMLKPFAHTVPMGGFRAFRPSFDTNRNLNVLGDGPYVPGSTVAAWDGWGGGDSNEVWAIMDVTGLKQKKPGNVRPGRARE